MRNLIEFLARHNHWFVFLLLEVISIVLLLRFNSYQGSVWFTSAGTVAGTVSRWDSQARAYFHLQQTNADLTMRNVELEQQLQQAREQISSLQREHADSVDGIASSQDSIRLIQAKVVSNSVDKPGNLMTIDKGNADGIHPDMGVACGTGVVGIVYMCGAHYSIVVPVLNARSNISCSIEGRGYFGYLRWTGGASDVAYVDDVPRHAKFRKGDKIITSGYSAVFPRGINVGRVVRIENSKDGLSYRLQVKLSTDFAKLRDVCVIDDRTAMQRLNLLRAAQDSIKTLKN